ncbi:MAG: hypothetical protein K0S39_337 [Paenibacillus sp.]|jgi:DUF1680 family protein|nr:hypothetical protein [Paenibacillus sp.]
MKQTEVKVVKQMEALSLKDVDIQDSFWTSRQKLVKETVIPYQWDALNDAIPGAEPSHTIENFRIAAGDAEGAYYGKVFQDSDLAKWLETVGFSLSLQRDEHLERIADETIDLIGRAQRPDGYVNTYFTVEKPGQRWTNLRDDHELYCAGHMIEAAVAYYEATGKTKLLDIMCRYADYIGSVFGAEQGKIRGYDGHPEIELALVKLYRATKERKYLELSKFFVDERGQSPHFFDAELAERHKRSEPGRATVKREYDYFQAHRPVREQHTAEGHAVRAVYLYSSMADLAVEYNDEKLLEACKELWKNVTRKRMYVTGGIGSSSYEERFTVDYDLPNDRAYTETCASIGLMFWAHRMLEIEADREYADVMEHVLYNGLLSGISLDGKSYFYVNPLEVWPSAANHRNDMRSVKVTRQPWFGCACCPPNISRLMASLGQYIYSQNHQYRELYVHLYVGSKTNVQVGDQQVELLQQTDYPWSGKVNISLSMKHADEFTLALRLPGWCKEAKIVINGVETDVTNCTAKGYVKIRRQWQDKDQIELAFVMPVEIVRSNPKLRENAGKIALQRGPVLFCLEEVDNGTNLCDLVLPANSKLAVSFDEQLLGGVPVISGYAWRTDEDFNDNDSLYSTSECKKVPVPIKAIPYFAWSNRGPGEMAVWIREY